LDLGRFRVVARALCHGELVTGILELLFQVAGSLDRALFVFPLCLQA
jgi:hypothetical protein